MGRVRAWFGRNLDVLVFGLALVSVGPLMGWWSVLVRRSIMQMDHLRRLHIEIMPDADRRIAELAALDQATQRQLFMITGETVLAGLLLVVLAVVLFAVARSRARENRRLRLMFRMSGHQLKTPIAGVRALLQSLAAGSIPAEMQKEFLGRGVAECDRLEHLVETLLAYQRSLVQEKPRLVAVSSARLLEEILAHRRSTFPDEGLVWEQGHSAMLRCDPEGVRVVLENLLDNARKYGGGAVELAEDTAAGRWRLKVTDRGQGFDPAEGPKLFQPFERGGGSGAAHGSGLGLYIARQLARQMRGDLDATSEGPGKGATFTLELPLETGAGAAVVEVAHG